MDNKLLCTEGDWLTGFGRWSPEGPIVGFVIKTNEKDIVSLNMEITTTIDNNPIVSHPSIITTKEAEANAHLIAASKDLYNVLFSIIEDYQSLKNEIQEYPDNLYGQVIKALQKANPNYKP